MCFRGTGLGSYCLLPFLVPSGGAKIAVMSSSLPIGIGGWHNAGQRLDNHWVLTKRGKVACGKPLGE